MNVFVKHKKKSSSFLFLLCVSSIASLVVATPNAFAQETTTKKAVTSTTKTTKKKKKKRPRRRARPPKTIAPDINYDRFRTESYGAIPGATDSQAPVDRRKKIDPLLHQGGMLINAQLPEKGSLTYATHLFLGHQLTWTPTEDFMLSANITAPLGSIVEDEVGNEGTTDYDLYDNFYNVSGRFRIQHNRDYSFAIEPMGIYRRGPNALDTSELGVGVAATIDNHVSDNVTFTTGAFAYVPLYFEYNELDVDACPSRQAYINGECTTQSVGQGLPSGGQALMLYGAATFVQRAPSYAFLTPNDILTLKIELFTGISNGTFLDLEGGFWGRDSVDVQRQRYGGDAWGLGVPHGAPFASTITGGWSNGHFAAQFGVMLVPERAFQSVDDPNTGSFAFPMMTLAYKIF